MRRRLRRIAIGLLIAVALIYVAIVGLLYTFQRRLIYPGCISAPRRSIPITEVIAMSR
ncbi:hypothetical protein [Sphingomonas asaccharolytica]|uniref:hypothetical protein n=1 Tax=Sphingomonas asaccharolytica TaxID=40681 RepID=UPI000A9689C0|nr:hypothetical protein [Sphingomonas asaccharolytica]